MKIPLFDIDGTLVKTGSKLHEQSLIYAFKKVYGVNIDIEGLGIQGMLDNQHIIRVLSPRGLNDEEIKSKIKRMADASAEYFKEHKMQTQPEVLPGVKDLLERLKEKKIHLGLLTGNMEQIAWTKLERAGLKEYFTFGGFGNQAYQRVDLVYLAKKHLEKQLGIALSLEDFLIVGDTLKDIQCARDAKIKVITVASGHFDLQSLEQGHPDLNVETLEDRKVFDFILN
ncbi:MAG: HAD hydrolase-like protein [Patescibacteria group bacterium]|nr:HAD hydrolase-like protein [Patescibacteria group bacterium]